MVTLRRDGPPDPVQFFRDDLIQIKSDFANLVHKVQYGKMTGDKPSILAVLSCRRVANVNFVTRLTVAVATTVAKMSPDS